MADIAAELHAVETDLLGSFVGAPLRGAHVAPERRDRKFKDRKFKRGRR